MTRVCLVGSEDVNIRYELVSRETAREALATYDLAEPYANTVALETISLGSAVSLLNDLAWYLVRYADHAWVLEPSVSESEWLSRDLATAIRDGTVDREESGRFLQVFGVVEDGGQNEAETGGGGETGGEAGGDEREARSEKRRLVDPMYVARTGPQLPEYDIREVDDTVVVRVTESEFGA